MIVFRRSLLPVAACALGLPSAALAGMPSFHLTEIARARLENISFFLAVFFLAALLIRALWNYLRRDFTFLPHLSYGRALGVVAVWGLLFVLVLTMISGARELLTPGAWERDGRTYKLAADAPPPTDEPSARRWQKLDELRSALWAVASSHGGKFPADQDDARVPADRWKVPHPSGMRYLYVGGLSMKGEVRPLAFEPELFGAKRLVLFTNGEVRALGSADIEQALATGKPK